MWVVRGLSRILKSDLENSLCTETKLGGYNECEIKFLVKSIRQAITIFCCWFANVGSKALLKPVLEHILGALHEINVSIEEQAD